MKTKIQGIGRLEVAIVIAILILAAVIVLAIKVNKQKLPEKEFLIKKAEEKETISIKRLPVPGPKVEFPEKGERREFTKYEQEQLMRKREPFIEKIRQKQMEQLRENLKTSAKEEGSASTTKHNIYPSEEDIEKMEKEKVLLY